MKIAFRQKEVTTVDMTYYVYLEGEKFELFDLLDTLEACRDQNNIQITNQRMVKFLKEKGILKHNGNRNYLTSATLNKDIATPLIKKLEAKRERIYKELENKKKN